MAGGVADSVECSRMFKFRSRSWLEILMWKEGSGSRTSNLLRHKWESEGKKKMSAYCGGTVNIRILWRERKNGQAANDGVATSPYSDSTRKSCDVISRGFLLSSHLHSTYNPRGRRRRGVSFFFGPLIIFEDGVARLAPIFVNVAQKLDDGGLAVFFVAWSIGDTTTPYIRILPSSFFLSLNV